MKVTIESSCLTEIKHSLKFKIDRMVCEKFRFKNRKLSKMRVLKFDYTLIKIRFLLAEILIKIFAYFWKQFLIKTFLWYGVILCVLSVLTRTSNLPPISPITHNLPIFICWKQKRLQKKFIFKQLSECPFNCLGSILDDQSKMHIF